MSTALLAKIWQRILSIILLGTVVFLPVSSYAEESLCAVVKIEIKQELTLERQAFDAHMRINNGLSNIQLENVQINVNFADEDGNSVRATSDSTDTSALFFIRVDSMDGISDVSGSGTIAPESSADIHWLIIPSAGAGGSLPSGTLYHVGATLSYTLGGEQHTTAVTPDYIYVKPQPQLTLDYFLPRDVYADDAFTLEIEPPVPFTLGVRVKNDGYGAARNLKIDSAQPKIVENKQGLLIGFKIIGSTVNNQSSTPSLLIDFGDIEAEQSAVGRWQMTTTLSGEFTEFNAEFSHSDDLGGELTSLLKATNTHFLVKDVLVELPGRDHNRDFLADDGGVLRVYESHGLDTEVNDHSANTTMELMSQSGSEMTYRLNAPVTAGFLYVKLADPYQGAKAVSQAVRSDGKVLPLDNVWLSKTRREDNGWDYFINLFDSNSNGQYQITLDTTLLEAQPPVLQFVPDRTTRETQQISFLVEASDSDGTIPTLSAASLPTGAEFTVQDEGRAVFDWTPVKGQAGKYEITFLASDGTLETSQMASITVNYRSEDSDGDGVLDTCEMQYFGNLERDGSGDFDGDGFLDRDECLQQTDPTLRIAVIINEVDALVTGTEMTEFIELYDGGQGNMSLDGLVVVLFNGELDQSYKAFNLDGFTTSAQGYFVIGGSGVTGADMTVSTNDWLADGADAVALYMGDASEFPDGTALTTTRLLDALVYDSDDANDAGLLALLHSGEPQVNEGGTGDAKGHSLGRCENGTGGQRNSHSVIQALPTPGATNNCQANLSLTMTQSADSVNIGAGFSYTLTVNNVGPDTAFNVQLVDTLPSGVSFVSATGTDWTCHEAGGTVTCELASLSVGDANPIVINVIAPSTAGDISNQALVSSATAESDSNNSVSEVTTVNAVAAEEQADLSLSLTGSADLVNTNTALSYTLIVSNAGPQTASNVQLVDTLPSGVSFVSATGTDWTCHEAGGTVICDLASLSVGDANPIVINVTAPSTAGEITNQATVSSATAESDSSNNSVSEVTTVNAVAAEEQADLSLSLTGSADSVNTNTALSYTLIVSNAGPQTASNVQLVDTLPSGVSFVSATGTDWTCHEAGGTVTCELASLSVGDANPIVINVTAPSTAGEITNQAVVSSATAESDSSNNSVSEVTTVNAPSQPPTTEQLTLTADPSQFSESAGANASTVIVTRTGDTSNAVTVHLTSSNASEVTVPATVMIQAGSQSVTFEIAAIDDTVVDGTQTVTLTATADGYTDETVTLAVTDNEGSSPPPTPSIISFSTQATQVRENQQIATITVTRSGNTVGEITVDYATIDETAQVGLDYQAVSGTLIWLDGEHGKKTFSVEIVDNVVLDGDKRLKLSLDNLTGTNASFAVDTATLTIIDDERPQPGTAQFANTTVEVSESDQTVILTVNRVGGSDGELVVNYATANGTATADSDYVRTHGKLTWISGDSAEKTVTIAMTDDTEIEGNELFTVTLFDETDSESLDSAAVFISDNDNIVVELQPCPSRGLIDFTCNAQGETLTSVTVVEDVSLANAVLEDFVYNQGWISNSTVQTATELVGGIITGYMTNKGTMKDFEFRGALVNGGTLSGDITNNSTVGGTFKDVHLTANTRIRGGKLQGIIIGDVNAPARLENVEVKDNSYLSGVVISDTVKLGDYVVFGEGVRFTKAQLIPTALELTSLLPTLPSSKDCDNVRMPVKHSDLSADVLEPSEGILAAINALPDIDDNDWVISQHADYGYLQLTIDEVRFAVQALSVTNTNRAAALELLEQQSVRFVTDTGIQVLAHPSIQAPCVLQASLATFELPDIVVLSNGNLKIPAPDGNWFSARADWISFIREDLGMETGLFFDEHPDVSGNVLAYTLFTDNQQKLRQQFFHPAPASPEALYSAAQQVVIERYGLVGFNLDGQSYYGVVDYLVTTAIPPANNRLLVEPISDSNGDGLDDWLLVYPNGDIQILFQSDRG